MPNVINADGLTIATQSELISQYTSGYQAIYGTDINLGPETPDGETINNFIQTVLDVESLIQQVNAQFDPDQAVGVILDQRVAINGIQRQAGTYTVTNVTLVLTQSVNLYGLDQTIQQVYTVADNAGNQWELQTTQLGVGPGTVIYAFQSATPGALTTVPNTITVPVTVVLGVQSINNPTTYTTLGINEESDAALRVRRAMSVSLPSQGYLAGLLAALENIPGVTYAEVLENDTGSTNGLGIPGHSIWVIVAGSGSPAAIANAIYVKRNAGAGMYAPGGAGQASYVITQVDGSFFTVYWTDVQQETLYIGLEVESLNQTTPPNISALLNPLTGIPGLFTAGPGAQVNNNALNTLVQQIDPNTLVLASGFSLTLSGLSSPSPTLTPSSPAEQFSVTAMDTVIIPPYITAPTGTFTITGTDVQTFVTVAPLGTVQFTGYGGYGTYTWSVFVNNTGGSIDSATGLYTAGSTPGTDTIKVTDSFPSTPNYSFAFVTVT